jgi:hypothetical protein
VDWFRFAAEYGRLTQSGSAVFGSNEAVVTGTGQDQLTELGLKRAVTMDIES